MNACMSSFKSLFIIARRSFEYCDKGVVGFTNIPNGAYPRYQNQDLEHPIPGYSLAPSKESGSGMLRPTYRKNKSLMRHGGC